MKRTILITGASSGIGKALYDYYSTLDIYNVIGVSLHGPDIRASLPEGRFKVFAEAPPYSVDFLINCAGIMPFDEDENVMDVNFWGTYYMCQIVGGTAMNKSTLPSNTCIINIASVSGMVADPELPIYAASKAAVISLTKSLAKKYAPYVRVNCISPGFYKTNLVPGDTPNELIETIPMGFEEDPKALIQVVDLIWRTEYMTGANIVVDGGVSL